MTSLIRWKETNVRERTAQRLHGRTWRISMVSHVVRRGRVLIESLRGHNLRWINEDQIIEQITEDSSENG